MATGSPGRTSRRELTDQQRAAITRRDVSVALSAGAGCGKTFVLTARFLSHLGPAAPEPAGLANLIAITFTERAAREMRDRIRQACLERLLSGPENESAYWRELIRELDSARISTIHSFCGSLLRAHAVEAGLDPQFQVLDAAQAQTLFHEVVGEQLRERLARREEAMIDLVVQYGLDSLGEMVARLLRQRQEIDWPAWSDVKPEELVARWDEYACRVALPWALQQIAGAPAARTVLEVAGRWPSSHPVARERFATLLDKLRGLPGSKKPADELAAIRDAAKVQGAGKKTWSSEEDYERFRGASTELRGLIDKAAEQAAFDPKRALAAARTGLSLLGLAAAAAEAYDRRKSELAVLDFDDLLIHAGRLLLGPNRADVRQRLSSQLRLLLVDEFQDTDPLQVDLVKALCDDRLLAGRLFFVGDYKQSIYRFRGAQPHVFRQLRELMPEAGRLPLSLNFRSQPAILDFVNHLFCEDLGPEYEALEAHRPQVGPAPAVELLWAVDPEQSGGGVEVHRRREAEWIARRLRGMLDAGERMVWDDEAARQGSPAARPLRQGDIALLFRALTNVGLYEEALRRYGIDYYLVGGHAFYAQQEIYDVLNLLRAVDSQSDELSLVGALRSPIFGLLDETLFWLARRPGGLSAGLFAEPGGGGRPALPELRDEEQRRRAARAARTLAELRSIKDRVPIATLLHRAFELTGYDAVVLTEFLGARKLANLRKLVDQARSFDESGIFTLADFITQLAEFVARQPDEPLAATCAESSDVVRLMSIHQAKGLEFPLVVVPDLDSVRRGQNAPIAFTPELGPLVKDRDGAASGYDLFMKVQTQEDLDELTRLLYVATTRAADYLILSAGLPQLGAAKGPWTQLVHRRFDPLTGAPRRQATGRPGEAPAGGSEGPGRAVEVRVSTSEPPLDGKAPGAARRRDLARLVADAKKAAEGGRVRVPQYLAAIPPDPSDRRQFSFSRLTGVLHPWPGPASAAGGAAGSADDGPADAESEPALDPRGLGTLVHAVLAEIDFAAPGDVAALVRRHAVRHLGPEPVELDEPIEMIERFLSSLRADDLAAAREIHRELEFLLVWPPGSRQPNGRYLQGFIDCLYRDSAGYWRIVDYKTNRVSEATLADAAAGYQMQMLVYALAAERILGEPPDSLVLCFLRPGLEHHVRWDDRARRRVVEMVDQAIAELPA